MPHTKTKPPAKQEPDYGPELIEEAIRGSIRDKIETVLHQELDATLGAGWYRRTDERAGYRNGTRPRTLATSLGTTNLDAPRGRLFLADGSTREFESQVLRRYKRRTKQIDKAILEIYLSGCNTRRIKKALRPLLRGVPLSKSAISRLVEELREDFDSWCNRDLSKLTLTYIYMDAIHVKIRMAGRVCGMPVLVTVGVLGDGKKILLSLDLRGSESTQAWTTILQNLTERGLPRPVLVIADGNRGLRAAIDAVWPKVHVQRCTVHKLRNLFAHAPKHAQKKIHADYLDIVNAKDLKRALEARKRFITTWSKQCPAVARSLQEAGEELLTFYRYPKTQWKSLRSTNVIERVHGEFRRRIKTQASLPGQDAVLLIMFGLLSTGQIRMRSIEGYQDMHRVHAELRLASAG